MMSTPPNMCSVCERQESDAGSLVCTHSFCHDCFSRFIAGSLDELEHNLRCCICGKLSTLTIEIKEEDVLLRFGRDQEPRFVQPLAVALNKERNFVIPDAGQNRIIIYDSNGQPKNDFAYTYGTRASGGVALTTTGLIVVPFEDNMKQFGLAFYTQNGAFLTSTYTPSGSTIGSVSVNPHDHIYITDPECGKIYVIKEGKQKIVNEYNVSTLSGDYKAPQPYAIVHNGEGNMLFTDIANHNVKVLNPEGYVLYSFGSRGERPQEFNNPVGITVDDKDRIIVADRDNHRVQLFDSRGSFLDYVVRYNQGDDVYMAPIDVTCLGGNKVAVLLKGIRDAQAGEIRVYSYADL